MAPKRLSGNDDKMSVRKIHNKLAGLIFNILSCYWIILSVV